MPITLTIDQRKSRSDDDLVERWVTELNHEFAGRLLLPFVPTVGDELQALTDDASVAADLALRASAEERWWIGVGVGSVELPLGATAARSRGPAFYRARTAVNMAKSRPYGFAVVGAGDGLLQDAEAALNLVAFIIASRGTGERARKTWSAIELASSGCTHAEIGERLDITRQAVAQRLRTAGFQEEMDGRVLAVNLLEQARWAGDG